MTAIVGADPFRGVCRISRAGFIAAIMGRRHNPGLEAERDVGEYWDESRAYAICPLFCLSMAIHESQLLTAGVAVTTKSFGNTRKPSFGAQPVGETPGRTGVFPVFASFLDGCTSTVARLSSPVWPTASPYGQRPSIESVFNDPSGANWAPFGDGGNDPNSYLSSMLRLMNQYTDQDEPIRRPSMSLTIHQRLTPINHTSGRDGHRVRAIVEHITDGDTAAGAIKWFASKASKVSAHYVVDRDGTIYQCVLEEDTAWANGVLKQPTMTNPIIAGWVHDGVNPNSETVSIEAVGRPDQGWTIAQLAVIDLLTRDIAARWGVPIGLDTVIGHQDLDSVTRARCPSLTEAQWDRLRTPAHLSDDQKLQAAWQANAQAYGDQRYSGYLDRPYYSGKVLRCDHALLTPAGVNLTATHPGGVLDDVEQWWADQGVLTAL